MPALSKADMLKTAGKGPYAGQSRTAIMSLKIKDKRPFILGASKSGKKVFGKLYDEKTESLIYFSDASKRNTLATTRSKIFKDPDFGGGAGSGDTPSTTPAQGFDGGSRAGQLGASGGGGGGASEAGSTDGTSDGGDGASSSITGSAVTRAGGGGATNLGTGGDGGGGNGGGYTSGTAGDGTANTGGGGGGQGYHNNSGAGGKGVVIISVPTGSYTGTTTGSPTVTTSGGNTIMQFNSSGSYTS